jgi:hypothetical protein
MVRPFSLSPFGRRLRSQPSGGRFPATPRFSTGRRTRACCILVESMALAHPTPLVGAGRGGGSRGPWRLSNAPSLARRVGRRDPPPLSSSTRGKEARWGDPRVNSRAEGARAIAQRRLRAARQTPSKQAAAFRLPATGRVCLPASLRPFGPDKRFGDRAGINTHIQSTRGFQNGPKPLEVRFERSAPDLVRPHWDFRPYCHRGNSVESPTRPRA